MKKADSTAASTVVRRRLEASEREECSMEGWWIPAGDVMKTLSSAMDCRDEG